MVGQGRITKLQYEVQAVACEKTSSREITVFDRRLLIRAGAVTAQAILILFSRGSQSCTIHGDARDSKLRRPQVGSRIKSRCRGGGMRLVTVGASGVSIVIQDGVFAGRVRVAAVGKRVSGFLEIGENVADRLRQDVTAVMANKTALGGVVVGGYGISRFSEQSGPG